MAEPLTDIESLDQELHRGQILSLNIEKGGTPEETVANQYLPDGTLVTLSSSFQGKSADVQIVLAMSVRRPSIVLDGNGPAKPQRWCLVLREPRRKRCSDNRAFRRSAHSKAVCDWSARQKALFLRSWRPSGNVRQSRRFCSRNPGPNSRLESRQSWWSEILVRRRRYLKSPRSLVLEPEGTK